MGRSRSEKTQPSALCCSLNLERLDDVESTRPVSHTATLYRDGQRGMWPPSHGGFIHSRPQNTWRNSVLYLGGTRFKPRSLWPSGLVTGTVVHFGLKRNFVPSSEVLSLRAELMRGETELVSLAALLQSCVGWRKREFQTAFQSLEMADISLWWCHIAPICIGGSDTPVTWLTCARGREAKRRRQVAVTCLHLSTQQRNWSSERSTHVLLSDFASFVCFDVRFVAHSNPGVRARARERERLLLPIALWPITDADSAVASSHRGCG
jgi:hypothetical protein